VAEPEEAGNLELDPDRGGIVFVCGKKGSGKSWLCRSYFDAYPFDRIVIDPNGDLDLPPDTIRLIPPIPQVASLPGGEYPPPPAPWPFDELGHRVTLHYVPDLNSPDWEDALNAVVLLAFARGRCLLWVDEIVRAAAANRVLPAMDLTLQQFRHRDEVVLLAGPRPVGIAPLCITQADLAVFFKLRGIHDRKRVSELLGIPMETVDALLMNLERFHFVAYDDRAEVILLCPPLPAP